MARKRRERDSLSAFQRLAERIRGLQTGERRANVALDALTGKLSIQELADAPPAGEPQTTPASSTAVKAGVSALPEARQPLFTRHTVYLSLADLENLSFIARHRLGSDDRGNRSELIRTAIRVLRTIIEQTEGNYGPGPGVTTGENRSHDPNR